MNRFKFWLTKKYLGKDASDIRIAEVPVEGGCVEVVLYKTEQRGFLGQHTIIGSIVINDVVAVDPAYLHRITLHELAHSKQWWASPLFFIASVMWMGALYALLAAITNRLIIV